MQSFVTSGTATFTYLEADQEDRAEESESTLTWAQWYPGIRGKQPLYQDLGISEEQRTFPLARLVKYIAWVSCSKDLPKAWRNIETVTNYWRSPSTFVFTEEEKSVSTLKDITEIEIETPDRKRITWGQAHMLAFISLRDAEERRRHFAEEEAKRTAVWEEWD